MSTASQNHNREHELKTCIDHNQSLSKKRNRETIEALLGYEIFIDETSMSRDEYAAVVDEIVDNGGEIAREWSTMVHVVYGDTLSEELREKCNEFCVPTMDILELGELTIAAPSVKTVIDDAGAAKTECVIDTAANTQENNDQQSTKPVVGQNAPNFHGFAIPASFSFDTSPTPPPPRDNTTTSSVKEHNAATVSSPTSMANELLTSKYAPTRSDQIVGNGRALRAVRAWFDEWKLAPEKRSKQFARALLLCGVSGIGKTTMAHVCAREAGYSVTEYNASDVRNKSAIEQVLGSVAVGGDKRTQIVGSSGTIEQQLACIVMDEVDGMSAGDRGGAAALIAVIKQTRVPIVCICNDKWASCVKTLKSHARVIDMYAVSTQECVTTVQRIVEQEHLPLDAHRIRHIAEQCRGDLRHALISVDMMSRRDAHGTTTSVQTQPLSSCAVDGATLSPFAATTALFSSRETLSSREQKALSADMMPLFVHENVYASASASDLSRLGDALDYVCLGDIVDAQVYTRQAWTLMPMQVHCSVVAPTTLLRGSVRDRIQFPQILGRESRRRSVQKTIQRVHFELRMHNENVWHAMYTMLCTPLMDCPADAINERVQRVVDLMKQYRVGRAMFDQVLTMGRVGVKATDKVPQRFTITRQTKAALTRACKKASLPSDETA